MSTVEWTTDHWHSENGSAAPTRVVIADDRLTAKSALRLAESGAGLLWRGDFGNARQLLTALRRRTPDATVSGKLLIELEPDHSVRLRRAPDVRAACTHAYGPPSAKVVSLQELLGVLGAYQWHRKGIPIAALGDRIHPAYGVFAPTRDEYVDLVARAPLPPGVVFDIGTGTGVLAAVLARRGSTRVVATDVNPRAVRCARDNVERLGLADRVRVIEADLWPPGRADLVVCNPPWLPGRPTSALELGVYDPGSVVLQGFLDGLADHLTPAGESWLILSDVAEHRGLRTRAELLSRFERAGLTATATHETTPRHRRANADETTTLWRLTRGT